MGYYKLTKGSSGEVGVDRAAKNLNGTILQPIITDSGGTAIANSWFANMYKSASGSSNGDITAARYLYSSGNKLNNINIPSASGKTLATTDQITIKVSKYSWSSDADGLLTFASGINLNKIFKIYSPNNAKELFYGQNAEGVATLYEQGFPDGFTPGFVPASNLTGYAYVIDD